MFVFLAYLFILGPYYIQANHDAVIDKGRGILNFLLNPCNCDCGVPNRGSRLSAGEFLRTYEFPWLASIQIRETNTSLATLINNKYVVTSAAPLIGLTPYDVRVTLGQFDRCSTDTTSTNSSADRIIIHPEFNPGNRANDIALVRLKSAVVFERRISSLCLSIPETNYVGQVATVVGWNQATSPEQESCRPVKVGLPVIEVTKCLGNGTQNRVSNDKRCVGVVGGQNSICKVDSGGPVMYRSRDGVYELIGILTDSNDCEGTSRTAIYTTINDHLPWIIKNTQDACFCTRN